jgi:HAD superfamily hydrolase (TIGR01509 family)
MRDIFTNAALSPIAGIPELIDGIKQLGIPCGVASSSSHELIELLLEKIGCDSCFDFVVSGEDVVEGKPAPDIYLKAAEKAGIEPKMCIAVEDAPAGILSAKNAGLVCIAFSNPSTLGQDFSNANYKIDKFDEAFPIIKTLFFRAVTGSLV